MGSTSEYGKNLDHIESHCLNLHEEAKRVQENAVAKMVLSLPTNPNEGSITFQDIPENPFAELGLSRKQAKGGIAVLSHQTEEFDRYSDVRKNDVIGFHPEWNNLDYDPFPAAENEEVVRRIFMGRELVIYAKLKAPVDAVKLGMALEFGGHRFALHTVTAHLNTTREDATFDVKGSEWLSYTEPPRLVSELRKELARKCA